MNFDVETLKNEIYDDVKRRITNLDKKPVLALVSTTDGIGVRSYKKSIVNNFEPLGIEILDLKVEPKQKMLLEAIEKLNADQSVDGILVLKPLAEGIDEDVVDCAVLASKDVDAINPDTLAKILIDEESFIPCTAEGVLKLLDYNDIDLKGKDVVIVNNSQTIGKPLALLMTNRFATVTLCHEFTKDLDDYTKKADILVTGAGVSNLITQDMLKDDAIVVDVGVTTLKENGKDVLNNGKKVRCGDVNRNCGEKASLITSLTPGLGGGTGQLTTALLAKHVVDSIERD